MGQTASKDVESSMMQIHTYETRKDYTVYGDTWHVAAFKGQRELRPEITRWCYQTYGEPGFRYDTHEIRWKDSIHWGEIHFSRPQDLEWFVLRWS